MEKLVDLVVELGKCLYVPFKRHCGYLCCYAKNVKELEDEVESLQKRMEYMNEKLHEQSRLNMTPLQEVKDWKGSVDMAVKEAAILKGQLKEEQRCLMGWCPNLRWRHGVGKKASKQIDQVQQLKRNDDGFKTIVRRRSPPPVEEIRSGGKFVATTVMEQVMEALRDDNVRSIGIYGMGGIGKTTLVKEINNNLEGSGRFDMVIFVTVSQNQMTNVIQDHIAERLDIKLEHKDNNMRANRLLKEFRNLKRVLIILDDVWTELEVEKLGLPRKDEHECCKIIVTTRNQQVCDQMAIEKQFKVKPLSDKDAWDLFKSKVGDVLKNRKLLEVGEVIVKKCGGCPLAIVTLGSTLARQEDENMWLDASRRLESPESTQLNDGTISEVITCIEFSYDHLKDPKMKFCFLFCSLFPEDYDISLDHLKYLGIGEGFLGVGARVQLMAYIKRLKNCSLLLEGDEKNHVKMHDVVRITAQYIASKEGHGFIEKTRQGLEHWPTLDNEEECKQLSLIGNKHIKALPDTSKFSNLRTLLLKDCKRISHIPDDFFMGMDELVNLDLSGMSSLKRWPKSISLLKKLRSLLLGFSSWHTRDPILSFDIDDLAKLKKLEVLVIIGVVPIPVEFAELSNLKILNLESVHLELIPANVISRLHNLEELYLNIRPNFDEKEGGCKGIDEIRSVASIVEVAALKRLTVLQVWVRAEEILLFQDCSHVMSNNGWGHELKKFKIAFGNNFLLQASKSGNTLVLGKLPELVPEWILWLIEKVERLHLIDWRPALKKVLYLDTVTTLKQMKISNCSTLLQIASTEEEEEALLSINILTGLEWLQLVQLSNLENIICQGPQFLTITESFVMRVLEVHHCCKLVNLLPLNLLQALQLLEKLHVEDCEAMRHIFVTRTTTDQGSSSSSANNYDLETKNCLEHLVDLKLVDMPNLVRICDGPFPDGFLKNLNRLWLMHIPDLVRICDGPVPDGFLKNLEDLQLEDMPSLVRICDGPVPNGFLKNLKVLQLEDMPNLVRICDGPVPDGFLKNLKVLQLEDMPTLVRICDGPVPDGFLKNLQVLHLVDMPNLVRLHDGPVPDGFLKNLKWVRVTNCGKFAPDVFSQVLVHCTENLEDIHLEKFYSLDDKDYHQYFNFHIIEIEKMETLISLPLGRPGSCHLFQKITRLSIEECPTLKSICSFDSTSSTGTSTGTTAYFIFPKLESLSLRGLEKLDSIIWTGSNPLYIGSSSFQNLRELHVSNCNSLRYLFSPLLAKHLPRLGHLVVESCERLEKLILITDGEEESTSAAGRTEDVLPQLKYLYLDHLPEQTSVFSVETIFLPFPSLEIIQVLDCSKLKHLSLGPNSSPLLKEIRGSQEWLQALEENMTMETKSHFKPLFQAEDA